jgi:hypothetical protein
MSLVVAGIVPLLFIVLVVAANASCPAVFVQPRALFWLSLLAVVGGLTIVAGIRARRGSRLAPLIGQLPAGLVAGLLVQPSSSIVFAAAIAIVALVLPQRGAAERLAAFLVLLSAAAVGMAIAFSPLVLGDPVRC